MGGEGPCVEGEGTGLGGGGGGCAAHWGAGHWWVPAKRIAGLAPAAVGPCDVQILRCYVRWMVLVIVPVFMGWYWQ